MEKGKDNKKNQIPESSSERSRGGGEGEGCTDVKFNMKKPNRTKGHFSLTSHGVVRNVLNGKMTRINFISFLVWDLQLEFLF